MTTALPDPPSKVLLVSGLDGVAERLRAERPGLEIREAEWAAITPDLWDWADVYLGFRRPPVLGWGGLRWIHSLGAGVDAFLFRTDLPPAVLVTRSAEDFGPPIGEYVLARVLARCQRMDAFAVAQRARTWDRRPLRSPRGTRAVVVGTGRVGRGIARALQGVGVEVDGLSRRGRAEEPFRRVAPMERYAEVVAGAQWVVLAAPLAEATYHLLDRGRLAQAGGAYLINVGRGALVEEQALPEALERGWLSGAALDVFEVEPLPVESPLWRHPGVLVTPHSSGFSTPAVVADSFLDCLAALEAGRRPRLAVDPAVGY